MGRSQETFNKKEKEKKKQKKRQEKEAKRAERKAAGKRSGFENMIAYVDEFGQVTDTPPDPTKKKVDIKLEDIQLGAAKREKVVVETVRKGRVDYFDHSKGFGFIKENGTQEKFFVHITSCQDEIIEGNNVTFEVEQGAKGLNAVKVKKT